MHYYKRNLGDYAKKAGRLSMLQHGAYTLLIDACYDREQFPTMEEAIEWTWASSSAEVEAVEFVLRKFFVIEGGKYVQKRIQEELFDYNAKSEKNSQIARDREEKRKNQKQNVIDNKRNEHETCTNGDEAITKRHLTNNQEPITKNHKPLTTNHKPDNSNELLNTLPRELVSEFLSIRKTKKQPPPTERAMNQIAKEAESAGITLLEAITACCDYGWASFKADWYAGKTNNKPAATLNMKNGKPILDREGWTAKAGEGWYTPWGTREGWHDGVFFENDCEMMGAAA